MKRVALILLISLYVISCSNKNNNEEIAEINLSEVKLVSPLNNEACTSGSTVSAIESKVTLKWENVQGAISYEIGLKNLLTGSVVLVPANRNQADVTILKSVPYSWFVSAKSESSTSASEVWKFYNSGEGINSYAPYPADLLAPYLGQEINSATVNLEWKGSDVDQDIVGYDLYFGTNSTPQLFKGNMKDAFLKDVPLTANTTYYWKVISKDAKGNSSDSGVFQFTVK